MGHGERVRAHEVLADEIVFTTVQEDTSRVSQLKAGEMDNFMSLNEAGFEAK